jgi:hypothetical protein
MLLYRLNQAKETRSGEESPVFSPQEIDEIIEQLEREANGNDRSYTKED